MNANAPLRLTMCATCPFRAGSPYEHLAGDLAALALTDASRICHSTGMNVINKQTGIRNHLCRGTRNIQLNYFHAMGVLMAPTDEAWNAARVKQGFQPTIIKNP